MDNKVTHQEVHARFVSRVREIECWIDAELWDKELPDGSVNRVASALLLGSIMHFKAIALLVEREMFAPAFSLLRVQWEGFVNGTWTLHCARPESVPQLWTGKAKFKDPGVAIQALEKKNEVYRQSRTLSRIHEDLRKALHGYTHMGAQQLQRLTDENRIGPVFTLEEVADALFVASRTALLTMMEVATIKNDVPVAEGALKQIVSLGSESPSCFHKMIPAKLKAPAV